MEIATELGLRHWGTRTVVYADERPEERPVTDVTIEIGNLSTRTEAIVGPAGSQVLIGQVVLETLARIMHEEPILGETQEPPCGTNVVFITF